MPIFISYNHADQEFAQSLAMNLVSAKHNVWIDTWELNAGDSLIERIEEALGGADAILVLLSENSVNSEWCKKELRSGLVRELEEKSVLVIPVVLDNCSVPLFLKEKLWIDFRKDKDEQLALLLRSLDRVSNPAQGRVESPEYHTDWSVSGTTFAGQRGVEWTFVDHSEKTPYVILTQVLMFPTGKAADAFDKLSSDDERYVFAAECMRSALDGVDDFSIVISSPEPQVLQRELNNLENGGAVTVQLTVRRMGVDNGMDTLLQVDRNLHMAIDHTLSVLRKSNIRKTS